MSATPTLKVLLVGDSGVGKSSLMLRFAVDTFNENISATIGIDFKVKSIALDDGTQASLQIWDTAGQERFRTLTSSYYRGAHAVILVFDANDTVTFQSLTTHWMDEVGTYCQSSDVVYMLVANKVDLAGEAMNSTLEKAETFARDNKMLFVKCSAKTKEGVVHAFEEVGRHAMKKQQRRTIEKNRGVNLSESRAPADSGPSACAC